MAANKLVVPGFGIGTCFGTPVTRALDSTSTVTLTGTVLPSGNYLATGFVTGVNLSLLSTTNGVTGTWLVLNGAPGHYFHDGTTGKLVNTTTSVSIVFIGY